MGSEFKVLHFFIAVFLLASPLIAKASETVRSSHAKTNSAHRVQDRFVWISRHVSNQKCVENLDDGTTRALNAVEAKRLCPPLREYADASISWEWRQDGKCYELTTQGMRAVSEIYCPGEKTPRWVAGDCHLFANETIDIGKADDSACGGREFKRNSYGTCSEFSKGGAERRPVSDIYCG